jgi:hypothetical protein
MPTSIPAKCLTVSVLVTLLPDIINTEIVSFDGAESFVDAVTIVQTLTITVKTVVKSDVLRFGNNDSPIQVAKF